MVHVSSTTNSSVHPKLSVYQVWNEDLGFSYWNIPAKSPNSSTWCTATDKELFYRWIHLYSWSSILFSSFHSKLETSFEKWGGRMQNFNHILGCWKLLKQASSWPFTNNNLFYENSNNLLWVLYPPTSSAAFHLPSSLFATNCKVI